MAKNTDCIENIYAHTVSLPSSSSLVEGSELESAICFAQVVALAIVDTLELFLYF